MVGVKLSVNFWEEGYGEIGEAGRVHGLKMSIHFEFVGNVLAVAVVGISLWLDVGKVVVRV
jgi:hypothetical protein